MNSRFIPFAIWLAKREHVERMLAALLLFICGLILSSMQEKDKRDFEYQLVETEERFIRACREDERANK